MASAKTAKGTIVEAKVIPSAKKEEIEYAEGVLKIWVKEPPDKDKANKAVLKLLKRRFGDCEIVSGHHGRKKTIRLKCVESGALGGV